MNLEEQYRVALEAVTKSAFRSASAREKQEILWNCISQIPYNPLPSPHISDLQTLSQMVSRAFLRKAFSEDDDVRPPRTKAFHRFGTVAKVRFVADGKHPYTGVLATGAVGFVRASLAVGMPKYSPAAAFKFLLDGPHPSENLLVHQQLDTQASRDFFERAPTNRTLPPLALMNRLLLPIMKMWLSPISCPVDMQRLDHLAEVRNDGTAVEHPVAPELVHLYGADEVRNDPACMDDFRTILKEIPSGSLLYRMFGRATPGAKQVYIGSVFTESAFVASEFGDRILAFQHAPPGSKPDSGGKDSA